MTPDGSVGGAVITRCTHWGQPGIIHTAASDRTIGVDSGPVFHSSPPGWPTSPPHTSEALDLRTHRLSPDHERLYDDFDLLFLTPIVGSGMSGRWAGGGRAA